LRPEVVFFSNGPGEVVGWLAPAIQALRAEMTDRVRVTVMIPPCAFSSGRETEIAERFGGVDRIVSRGRYLRFLFFGPKASEVSFESRNGVVVHLGGDHFQSGFAAKRLGFRAIAYTEGRIHHRRYFDVLATDYEESRQRLISEGVPPEQVVTIGNLMVDRVVVQRERESHARSLGLDPGRPVVGLLPGSRARWLDVTLTPIAGAVDCIAGRVPSVQFALLLAPTVLPDELRLAAQRLGIRTEGLLSTEMAASTSSSGQVGRLTTRAGTNIVVLASNRYDTMNCMDVAVTLPGTNTMELAALGVPMVVIVPMNEPEKIPLEGLPGLAGGVPFVGPWMKRKAIQRQAARIVFTALPNRRAGSCVVPEVRGCLTGPDIAGPVCELLGSSSERQRLSERLKSIAGGRGAASRLVGLIMDQLSISENA
jgi:hypothetical protein